MRRPRSGLPARALKANDGWCDAKGDRNYNRHVTHPYAASAERLWRSDGLYDVIVVIAHNHRPRMQGLGSAIFMHVADSRRKPTEGCVALSRPDLMRLVARIGRRTRIILP